LAAKIAYFFKFTIMQTLRFSTVINATKEKVWHAMLDDATYRQWTREFTPEGYSAESSYVGSWETGSMIKFIAINEQGLEEGMYSIIVESRPYEFVSIKHLGVIKNGVADPNHAESQKWAGALENYTFTPENGSTRLEIAVDTTDDMQDMMKEMWPKALQKLKEMCESPI
jgi:uncharacterized protein YndB with AHSA1/START domain